jgi:hypothetical protein
VRLAVIAVLAGVVTATSAGATQSALRTERQSVPHFRHVVLIVFENHEVDDVLGSSDAPTFNRLGSQYATISNYTAVAHPSLPNYLALVSGSTQGIDSDCTDCIVAGRSLADTLEDVCRRPPADRLHRSLVRPLRKEAQSLRLLSPQPDACTPPASRAPQPIPAGRSRSTPSDLFAGHSGSLS